MSAGFGASCHGAAQRRDRLGRVGAFEQRLALELVEIGIVGHRRDQTVDLRDGAVQIAEPVGRNGPRVARRQAGVGQRIVRQHHVRTFGEAVELRPHHVVAELQFRRVLLAPVRRLHQFRQSGHALFGHRMVLRVRIGAVRREQRIVGEVLERVVHAFRGLAGHGQKADAGAVGRFFLRALIGQQRVHRQCLRRGEYGAADIAHLGIAVARHHRGRAEQHADDHRGLRIGEFLAHLRKMAADDVAGLVREHADELIGHYRLHERAGIDENAVRIHDEGVERIVVDDDDLDVLIAQPGDFQNRRGVVAQQLFDLGVADHRDAGGRSGLRAHRHARRNARQRERRGRGDGDDARSWLHRPHLARRSSNNHVRRTVGSLRRLLLDRKLLDRKLLDR